MVLTKTASFGHPEMIYIMFHSPTLLDLLKCQILSEDMDETVTKSVQSCLNYLTKIWVNCQTENNKVKLYWKNQIFIKFKWYIPVIQKYGYIKKIWFCSQKPLERRFCILVIFHKSGIKIGHHIDGTLSKKMFTSINKNSQQMSKLKNFSLIFKMAPMCSLICHKKCKW